MSKNDKILQAIFAAVDQVNELLPKEKLIAKLQDSSILDSLDSLAIVNLIVATEQKIEEVFGVVVTLTDDMAFSQEKSPFETVGSLKDYISTLLEAVPEEN